MLAKLSVGAGSIAYRLGVWSNRAMSTRNDCRSFRDALGAFLFQIVWLSVQKTVFLGGFVFSDTVFPFGRLGGASGPFV